MMEGERSEAMKRQQNQALTVVMVASIILLVGTLIGGGAWVLLSPANRNRAKVEKLVEEIETLDKEYRYPSLRDSSVGRSRGNSGSVHDVMVGQARAETQALVRRQIWEEHRGELEEKIRELGGTPPERPKRNKN
jgi:hypothetical protein